MLKELEQAHQIIRECMREMNDEQILEVAKLNQNNNLSSLWAFRTHQRQKMIERAQRVLLGLVMSKANKNNLLISGRLSFDRFANACKSVWRSKTANFLQKLHYCLENNEGKILMEKSIGFTATINGKPHLVCIAYQRLKESLQS